MTEKFLVKIIGIIFEPKSRMILIGKKLRDKEFSFLEEELKTKEELDKFLKKAVKQKTGYKVHNLGAVYAENKIKGEANLLRLYFLCEATEGKEKAGKNVEVLKWIKPKSVEKELHVKLPPRLKEYIFGLE